MNKNKYSKTDFPFDIYEKNQDAQFQAIFDMVWSELNIIGKRLPTVRNLRFTLRNILSNLLDGYCKGKRVSISKHKDRFSPGSIYHKLGLKCAPFLDIFNTLCKMGLIEVREHIPPKDDRQGVCTQIYASQKLLELFKGVKELPRKIPNDLICMKDYVDGKKVVVEFAENDFSRDLEALLKRLNALYDNCYFSFDNTIDNYKIINPFYENHEGYELFPDKEFLKEITVNDQTYELFGIPRQRELIPQLDIMFPRLRTVYGNGSFYQGGRFYCSPLTGVSYQNLSQNERSTIAIDEYNTVELDYSCLHVSMLYALEGEEYKKYDENGNKINDAYEIGVDEGMRIILKQLMLTILNSANDTKAIRSMNKKVTELIHKKEVSQKELDFLIAYKTYRPNWQSLINRLREKHHKIRRYFCSGAGNSLQNLDSQVVHKILEHFTNKCIPCLPVHDSIIIAEQYQQELETIMGEAYLEVMKSKCFGIDKK